MIIAVKHNIEVAHRLSELPGKCQNIHGHSMWITLQLAGASDLHGTCGGLDFAFVKRKFRTYLDANFDHRLLLNVRDPLLEQLFGPPVGPPNRLTSGYEENCLPGWKPCPDDPTTENIAKWVFNWAHEAFMDSHVMVESVEVQETHVNMARYP